MYKRVPLSLARLSLLLVFWPEPMLLSMLESNWPCTHCQGASWSQVPMPTVPLVLASLGIPSFGWTPSVPESSTFDLYWNWGISYPQASKMQMRLQKQALEWGTCCCRWSLFLICCQSELICLICILNHGILLYFFDEASHCAVGVCVVGRTSKKSAVNTRGWANTIGRKISMCQDGGKIPHEDYRLGGVKGEW